MTLTGGGPETFQEISLTHIANLEKFIGLRHDLKKVDQSGLSLARLFLRGAWSGFYKDPEDWQDVAILTIA